MRRLDGVDFGFDADHGPAHAAPDPGLQRQIRSAFFAFFNLAFKEAKHSRFTLGSDRSAPAGHGRHESPAVLHAGWPGLIDRQFILIFSRHIGQPL